MKKIELGEKIEVGWNYYLKCRCILKYLSLTFWEIFQTVVFCKIQNSKVNNVKKVIIIQKAIRNSSLGQYRPPTNANAG
jgi:hypothetical protein